VFHADVVLTDHSLFEPPLGSIANTSAGLLSSVNPAKGFSAAAFTASLKAPALFGRVGKCCRISECEDEMVRAEARLQLLREAAVLAPDMLRS
jgi:hypothetical protein